MGKTRLSASPFKVKSHHCCARGSWLQGGRGKSAVLVGPERKAASKKTPTWHPGCHWKLLCTVFGPAAAFVSSGGEVQGWGMWDRTAQLHPSWWFLGGKAPATPETSTGAGEGHLHEPNGINYTRF